MNLYLCTVTAGQPGRILAQWNSAHLLHIKPSRFKIGYDTPGLVCGSCFAERIGQKMLACKMPVTLNPYGLLFNPASIAGMLDNLKVPGLSPNAT